MSNFYNEWELEEILDAVHRNAPELIPYANALGEWKTTVNSNSDGWAHWSGGQRAAGRIIALLEGARHPAGWTKPTATACNQAFSTIKAAATRHNLPAPTLPPAPKKARTQ